MNKREYITDNGAKILLPEDDERVMTAEELEAKYSVKKAAVKNPVCPRCHTYCDGDCGA